MSDLAAAIRQYALETGAESVAHSGMLCSFVVVAHWVNADPDEEGAYTIHCSSDSMPRHEVIGLLEVGAEALDVGE